MPEYISVKALLDKALGTEAYFHIKSIVSGLTSVDATEVVRCKDCQYWEYDHNYDSTIAFGYCRCRDWQTPWSESEIETVGMGYCHHGVRRED